MNKKPFYPIRAEVRLEITAKDVDDIMVAALEGGINHWCSRVEVVGTYLGEYASEQISRCGSLRLYDRESNDVYELTLEKFLDGIRRHIESQCHICIDNGGIDTSDVDAEDADCIIQYALFQDIIYG